MPPHADAPDADDMRPKPDSRSRDEDAETSTGLLRPLVVLGTRPEAIKLATVIHRMRRCDNVEPIVCSTGQHREMLDQVLNYFEITPDVELRLMRPNQSLAGLTARCLESVDRTIDETGADCVVVQGDTTTVLAAAVAAFYRRLPVVHVEAGLRTGDLNAPWPEEFNRRAAGIVTTLHAAPTRRAADALLAEGVAEDDVRVTGNPVIDALHWAADRERDADRWRDRYPMVGDRPLVLITGHRRENFGRGLSDMCGAIADLADAHPDVSFVYPVHLNPNVRGPVRDALAGRPNVHLTDPASYPEFVWLMDRADVVLTDSGGVQEEAPSLHCEVIVTREKTERPEAVDAGLAELVGTDRRKIVESVTAGLERSRGTSRSGPVDSPYGDGRAADRIVDWMVRRLLPRR